MAFHEIRFPLRLALGVSGGPSRLTDIVSLSNGREARNQRWANSRRRYDAGSGIRSIADLYTVIEFFEARAGALHGFRFRDPLDFRSCRPEWSPTPLDQSLGTGDGRTLSFPLVKLYGDRAGSWARRIAKPVAGTVTVAVNGRLAPAADLTVDAVSGTVTFAEGRAPPAGAAVTAGFEFDVPVRFATDRLEVSLEAFNAGRFPVIPLEEIEP
ncbi:DUF2460 domain-containing protein [Gellertiella hungarica]|uniref:Uncharacterized protein (TIGR02217 family) n=1 Tax=Gellertiella hungarica TaxID=1572859 RepID=A0A7W6J888_9HYPH|nr:DUF2460 domain-containing protein [Gellertiella hungarica]MBB4065721.1 uncharacterized protein (TIGR02217 family) [Gellertiella hungarica]